MRVLMTGGGTGGHIYPALAIAEKIKEYNPDAQIIFAGTNHGLEKTIVPQNGYELKFVTASGLSRTNPVKAAKAIIDLAQGMGQSRKLIKEFRPDVVIGTGGYVCAPVIKVASKLGIKSYIHEANAFPGMTNRMLEADVEKVFVGFERAQQYFKQPEKQVLTGNPVRKSFFTTTKEEAREYLGISKDEFVILSFGGSQGAESINNAMIDVVVANNGKEKTSVYFGTGSLHYDAIMEKIGNLEGIKFSDNIHILKYIENMDKYLVASDIVISRAGALTLAEITACSKASILIPSPFVTGNHQYHNAKAVFDAGGAILIEENLLTGDLLKEKISDLRENKVRIEEMGRLANTCAVMDSADIIYREIFE